ncbi:MAG: DUF4118 domain-containing protein [Oscillospiraceae bacterium]
MKSKSELIKFLKNSALSLVILGFTAALCFLLRRFDEGGDFVSMLYILAVFLIARYTSGYIYGIASSLLGVLAVNFIFTYPYFEFDFTLTGYPLAMLSMLAVSIITSTLTTQAKQHEEARLEAEKEKTRSNLLRAVSHDLRTPLTSILGATSAIIENDDVIDKEERIKLLREVQEDSQWLIRMVENLLAITRIDGEQAAKIIKTPEIVEELIEESVTLFRKRFPSRNVIVSVPKELLIVPMDSVLIEQVIINLLENAVLHGKNVTEIHLTVNCEPPNAVFEVRDNGVGISESVLPHIFDGYFTQSYEDGGDKKKNMGIGLSVCSTIISAHNGKLRAFNANDGGAVFRFYLPLEDNRDG